eukprot:jgi/Psemu1/327522/estExt_fgenesh1_pg.C_6940007
MSVVGLDIGLQNCVISAAGRGGVDVILNGNSNRLNPAMVNFDESRKMGEQVAGSTSISKFKTTIKNMKRLVGLAFDDPRAEKEMKRVPYQCVPLTHASGGPASIAVKDWVIAIPPYYSDAQRRAVLNGCKIVGIPGVQRLMHENTATALAYGIFKDIRKEFTKEKPTNVMFIDMGASAYTVTIAAFEPGKLTIKSCNFDDSLGGRDFDEVIGNWVAEKFVEKYGKKLSCAPQTKPKVMLKIMAAAEKAKKTLSPQGVNEASINLECLMEDLDFNIMFKKSDYEAMSAPILAKLEDPIKKALAEAKIAASDLSSIELVGGSTRIGFLKKKLKEILGVSTLSTTMNADEAVSRGAALQSAILSPRFKVLPYEIIEYGTLPIKLAWDEDKDQGMEVDAEGADMPTNSVVMFGRGLNFPIVRRVTLRRDGEFKVSSSYDESAKNYGLESGATQEIANWSIKAPAGEEKKIRVNVKQDIHGIVQMSSAQMVEEIEEEEAAPAKEEEAKAGEEAKEGEAPAEKKKKVKRTNLEYTESKPLEWTDAEIAKFTASETAMRSADRIVQETSDMRNELESYIYNMRDKITMDSSLGAYASQAEKDEFIKKNDDTENWLYEDGFDAKKDVLAVKLGELKKLGGPVEKRAEEAQTRPPAVASLQQNVEKHKKWLADAQASDDYSHITEEEFTTCHKKCDEVSNWLYEMLDKQGSLAQNVDPAFYTADVISKNKGLTNVCSPIVHKPKPKPKPVAPKEEAKPAADAPADKAAEPVPMETEEPGEKKEDKMEVDEA